MTSINKATLTQVPNHHEFAFGKYPFAHYGPRGCDVAVRITKWQIRLNGDLLDNYPTKSSAMADVVKYGLTLISVEKYTPNT